MNELTRDKFLSEEEFTQLRTILSKLQAKEPRNTALLELMIATGARCGEILQLTKGDLNAVDCSVYIRGTKNSRDREIPIPRDLFHRINALPPEVGRIFAISYNRLNQIWLEYRPAAKGLHSLRHTAAIHLYKRTKDIKLTQLFLGHRSLNNTQIYTEFIYSQEELRRALVM